MERTARRIIFCLAIAFGILQHRAEAQYKTLCTGLSVTENIGYKRVVLAPKDTISLALDIYRCSNSSSKKHPVIIFTHGGGFWEGDKRSEFYVNMAEAFAKRGYVAFSVNYRLKGREQPYSRAVLDTCISDVMDAIKWIKANSDRSGIDTTKFFICGDSAGGGIVVNACFDNPDLFIGCIDLWGGLPGGAGWEAPIYSRWLPARTPPTLIMHGTADKIIPYATSKELYTRLTTAGVRAELHPLEGADHYPVQLTQQILGKMIVFADTTLKKLTEAAREPLTLVNPFIGTANSGNTNPGAVRPWGMVSVSPFNTYDPSKAGAGASPYIYGRERIYGFTHLNMSGLGCADMGIVCIMPGTGALPEKVKPYSTYSNEKASPGYYAVSLDQPGIDVELTTTCRTALSSFAFPEGDGYIRLDLGMGLTERKGGMLRLVSGTEIEGFKNIGNICGLQSMQTVYFVARLSKAAGQTGIWTEGKYFSGFTGEVAGNDIGAYFRFRTRQGEKVLLKTGFSYVSIANARANLDAEQHDFDFGATLLAAEREWAGQLSRISIAGGRRDEQVQFYTALYHALIHPNRADDVNAEYRRFESAGQGKADSDGRYTVFSLWDTYRSLHPLLCLVYPGRQSAMVKSLIGMSRESGFLPRWEFAGIETGAMTGDPSLPVIADTWLRGIRDFDIETAYSAMKRNALTPEKDSYMRPGMEQWLSLGFIPEDASNVLRPFDPSAAETNGYAFMKTRRIVWGSVSTALEYCTADWSLSQLAKALGHEDDHRLFMKRALSYRNNFDTASGFMRPRLKNGQWLTPFDPATHKNNAFTEGSAWNYTFMVPYDIPGLIELMGGAAAFRKKLDDCFDQAHFDITNEPDLAYPYLYNYLPGEQWRTNRRLRKLLSDNFSNSPGGLPGNDDCGELSSWLLFTMMGLYPDCPGRPDYQLTIPVFNKISIALDPHYYPGKTIVIEADHQAGENIRIKSIEWNGKKYPQFRISHQDLVNGGTLKIITQQ